jgi:hypothetical protein
MKGRFYLRVSLFFLVWLMAIPGIPLTKDAMGASPVKLEVYDPTGPFEVTKLHAPRLADLHGKTICEVSNAGWEAHRTFPLIRELLQRQFPTAKIIPYTEVIGTRRDCENVDYVAKMLKKKGCQAVIAGNAG